MKVLKDITRDSVGDEIEGWLQRFEVIVVGRKRAGKHPGARQVFGELYDFATGLEVSEDVALLLARATAVAYGSVHPGAIAVREADRGGLEAIKTEVDCVLLAASCAHALDDHKAVPVRWLAALGSAAPRTVQNNLKTTRGRVKAADARFWLDMRGVVL